MKIWSVAIITFFYSYSAEKCVNYNKWYEDLAVKERRMYRIERDGVPYENEHCDLSAIPDKVLFCWFYIYSSKGPYNYVKDMEIALELWSEFIQYCRTIEKSKKCMLWSKYVQMHNALTAKNIILYHNKAGRFYEKAMRGLKDKNDDNKKRINIPFFSACGIPFVECSEAEKALDAFIKKNERHAPKDYWTHKEYFAYMGIKN